MQTMYNATLERAMKEAVRKANQPDVVEFTIMQLYKIIMAQQETIEKLRSEK